MSHYNQQSTSNSNRVGAPIIPPSNELMSTPMTETVVIAREEYETLLSTVRQLTNTVEGLYPAKLLAWSRIQLPTKDRWRCTITRKAEASNPNLRSRAYARVAPVLAVAVKQLLLQP
jgi:hypothetical protein